MPACRRTQAQTRLRAMELQVATEVTNAAFNVQSNLKRVEAAVAARELAEKRLEAEQSKFEVGMTTNFFVVQAQRDLRDAQNSELRALADYRKSLVDIRACAGSPGWRRWRWRQPRRRDRWRHAAVRRIRGVLVGGIRDICVSATYFLCVNRFSLVSSSSQRRGCVLRVLQARAARRRSRPGAGRPEQQRARAERGPRRRRAAAVAGRAAEAAAEALAARRRWRVRPPMTVEMAKVARGKIALSISVVGNLIGEATVEVAPKTGGRLHVDQREAR